MNHLVIVGLLWIVNLAFVVRAYRRGHWLMAIVGLFVFAPAAWVGAAIKPVPEHERLR